MFLPFVFLKRYLAVGLLAGTLHTAFSHDTFETTTIAKVNAADLEVRLTLSLHGANALLNQSGAEGDRLTLSNFDAGRSRLAGQAAGLFEVSVENAALPLTDAKVVSGEEGDVEFLLTYPRPTAAEVQLHAAFLAKLGRGFWAQLTLLNDAGGGPIITLNQRDNPVVKWPLKPASESTPESPASPSVAGTVSPVDRPTTASASEPLPADVRPEQESAESTGTTFYAVFILTLVCMAGAAAWLVRRRAAR